jgi:hypothetical protein
MGPQEISKPGTFQDYMTLRPKTAVFSKKGSGMATTALTTGGKHWARGAQLVIPPAPSTKYTNTAPLLVARIVVYVELAPPNTHLKETRNLLVVSARVNGRPRPRRKRNALRSVKTIGSSARTVMARSNATDVESLGIQLLTVIPVSNDVKNVQGAERMVMKQMYAELRQVTSHVPIVDDVDIFSQTVEHVRTLK